jgi:hypothetical protein
MLATTTNYSQRIAGGKKIEHKIIDALRALGYTIDDPTPSQDMHDKIDGWWHGTKGGLFPLQIKFRETGDDILFELIADVDRKIEGRDMKSKATVYLIADRMGITRMLLIKPIKELAAKLLARFEKDVQEKPYSTYWEGDGWEMRLQYDRAHGQRKVVAYFSPRLFEILKTWNLKL